MKKVKLLLTTEQLELLLAFEVCDSLASLADYLHKDPSVVSRNLQRLGEAAPVIRKISRKWELSDLGRKINRHTEKFALELDGMLKDHREINRVRTLLPDENTPLVLVNTQKALEDKRTLAPTVKNIHTLLSHWRSKQAPVFHVRHVSQKSESLFCKDAPTFEFIDSLQPTPYELVFEKPRASVFSSDEFRECFSKRDFSRCVLVGFTGNDCIEASARSLSESGYETYVIGDATASLDMSGPDGQLHRAERVHALALANIHAYSAKVLQSKDVLSLQK